MSKTKPPTADLWADLDAESRKPGPTMTITKAQYAALLAERAAERAALEALRVALEELAADLAQDHRGIPYDVIERIDRSLAEDPA